MNKYRIRPVAPDKWIVEKRWLFFWSWYLGQWGMHGSYATKFQTIEEAERALRENVREEQEIKKHLKRSKVYVDV